jgi:hypothetical protein
MGPDPQQAPPRRVIRGVRRRRLHQSQAVHRPRAYSALGHQALSQSETPTPESKIEVEASVLLEFFTTPAPPLSAFARGMVCSLKF